MKCLLGWCIRVLGVALFFQLGACSGSADEGVVAASKSVAACTCGSTCDCGPRPREKRMSDEAMRKLRVSAWHLLAPFVRHSEGLPPGSEWMPRHQLMALGDGPMESAGAATLVRAMEQDESLKGDSTVYEMTFFNDVASQYIQRKALRVRATTDVLMAKQRREIEFPAGSVAVKTFWRHMNSEKIEVRK